LIRHNLDVMHIEKNFFDNIFYTVMNCSDRSKDNLKARLDIQLYCKKPNLYLQHDASGWVCCYPIFDPCFDKFFKNKKNKKIRIYMWR